jgi:hypothetical protein
LCPKAGTGKKKKKPSKKRKKSLEDNFLLMIPKRKATWRRVTEDTMERMAKKERKGVVMPGVEVRQDWIKDAKVVVYQKKKYAAWEKKLAEILGKDDVGRVWLDDFGASVWLLLDGKRDIKKIGEKIREEYGEEVEPLYPRLNHFLNILVQQDLIELKKK